MDRPHIWGKILAQSGHIPSLKETLDLGTKETTPLQSGGGGCWVSRPGRPGLGAGRWQATAVGLRSLSPEWELRAEFKASVSGLAQPWLLRASGEWTSGGGVSCKFMNKTGFFEGKRSGDSPHQSTGDQHHVWATSRNPTGGMGVQHSTSDTGAWAGPFLHPLSPHLLPFPSLSLPLL